MGIKLLKAYAVFYEKLLTHEWETRVNNGKKWMWYQALICRGIGSTKNRIVHVDIKNVAMMVSMLNNKT